MKLALVHMRHAGTGGTERYLNQVAAFAAQRGHEVTIVCRSHEDAPHPEVRFVSLRRPVIGAAWRMWAFAKDVERHIERSDYDIVYGLGKTWSQDVIRLGGGSHATYLELAHEKTLKNWERWTGRNRLKNRLALRIEERALARHDAYRRVVTNSTMVKRDVMQRYSIPEASIEVIYNGVDLERFHPEKRASLGQALREELDWSAAGPILLFLGTGYGRKGLDRILAVLPELIRERPGVRLLVVGYDSSTRKFEAEAVRAGLGDCVRFLGGRRDAERCFAAADVYVLPTRYDPFANSTLEALASGLPVITTDTNGASELIAEGVQGSVLHGAQPPAAMLDALRHWTEPGVADAARASARKLAEAHDSEKTAERSTRLLEEMVG